MITLLSCRSQQCLGPFTMFLVKRSSETGPFRHLSNLSCLSQSLVSEIHKLWGSTFIENVRIWCKFLKCKKNAQKKGFFYSFIWIDCVKLALLRTEYLSSAVILLKNSPKILHITRRDSLKLNFLYSDQLRW